MKTVEKMQPTSDDLALLHELSERAEQAWDVSEKAQRREAGARSAVAKQMCPFEVGDTVYRVISRKAQYGKVVGFHLRCIEKEISGASLDQWYVNVVIKRVTRAGRVHKQLSLHEHWPYFPIKEGNNNVRIHEAKSNT